MSYRIEISPNNRAACQDAVCKKEGKKLTKGEIRFGVYVTLPGGSDGHSSFKWRHWGCVSGKSIANLQSNIKRGDGYEWDRIDGYDELDDHPDVQEKIRRVIAQGHIDPEDFNGDPDFNKPGQTAIRGRAKKAKAGDEDEEGGADKASPKKGAKRGRKQVEDEDEDESEEVQPKAKRAKKAVVKADGDAPAPAAKGKRGKRSAVKAEEDEEEEPAPASKKKAVRKSNGASKPKRGRPKKAQEEDEDDED
ncbi:uncharacterized protein BCR38DRAFT_472708 [Pseudomassariella vexata]|uniref:PARP-type domain-containing protein n=1 Tax=Pseudomassariella vexata TaxID=1141098 RepID=A0A1Y2E6W6_9PEZI|nr:uncharacterized protein BCR38DRAFT_472708 [Pseudomassariella vexata]ORY67259.1 hypothetical protein BCR38DRAFT_472708 [Pseudomassariella vexata]